MAKASDNPFPSLLLVEGAAPTAPAAGRQRLFIDSADSVLKREDSGGKVTPIGGVKGINAQTGTAYTLALGDVGKFVTMTNAADSTLTVPTNATVAFPVGTVIEGAQLGAGQVTIAGASGVTINATPGLKVAAQYGSFGLVKTGTDIWLAMGRLSA